MADNVQVSAAITGALGNIAAALSYPNTQQTTTPTKLYSAAGLVAPVSGSPATLTFGSVTTPLLAGIMNKDATSSITIKVGTTQLACTLNVGDPPLIIPNPAAITIASSSGSLTALYDVAAYS